MKQRNLLKEFPDAPFLVRLKLWTPDRNIVDADGPYDDVPGHLLLMVASNGHPTGKKLKAMEDCLKVLLDE